MSDKASIVRFALAGMLGRGGAGVISEDIPTCLSTTDRDEQSEENCGQDAPERQRLHVVKKTNHKTLHEEIKVYYHKVK